MITHLAFSYINTMLCYVVMFSSRPVTCRCTCHLMLFWWTEGRNPLLLPFEEQCHLRCVVHSSLWFLIVGIRYGSGKCCSTMFLKDTCYSTYLPFEVLYTRILYIRSYLCLTCMVTTPLVPISPSPYIRNLF